MKNWTWLEKSDSFKHKSGLLISGYSVWSFLQELPKPWNIMLPEQIGFMDESYLESLLDHIKAPTS